MNRASARTAFCSLALLATLAVGMRARAQVQAPPSTASAAASSATPPVQPSEVELATLARIAPYRPASQVHGTIRLWGHGAPLLDFMGQLVQAWRDRFATFQPGVTFDYRMYGTASAMGALYAGKGDIAILGQEIYPFETTAFRRVKHYDPTEIEIATGSVDVRNFDFALGVFVNQSSPLYRLTLDQLDRIFAYQDEPSENILTWGQLGITGPQASHPIHLYGWHQQDVFSTFIERTALHGSHRWRCGMKQYAHIHRPDGTIYDSGQQILDALSNDPDGMALSNVRYLKGTQTRPLALARSTSGPYYDATKATLIARQYPLTRIIPAEIDQRPGQPIDPATREFLRFLVSREGQAEIVRNGKYLPLDPDEARRQLEKLQ